MSWNNKEDISRLFRGTRQTHWSLVWVTYPKKLF